MGLGKILKEIGVRLLTERAGFITPVILSQSTNYGKADIWVNGRRVFTFGTFATDERNFYKAAKEINAVVTRLVRKGMILERSIGINELNSINEERAKRNIRNAGMN